MHQRTPAGSPATDTMFEFDVAVVGMGYVGLPTSLAFREAGYRVLGVDVSEHRLQTIRDGRADLLEGDRERLGRALEDPGFELTSDAARLSNAAAVVIAVPTPVDEYLVPDLSILRSACATVVENAVSGQLVVLTSTSYVGCTKDMVALPLTARGLLPGLDVHVAFSPERINPGVDDFSQEEVPRVVGGITEACGQRAEVLLAKYVPKVHLVPTAEAAEMTKLLENTFRAVNIALANEFADICGTLNISVMDVIDAADTKPFGFMRFNPGPGVGGHCIPCDPHYLLWQLRRNRMNAPVIEQAMQDIAARPRRVVDRSRKLLSDRDQGLAGARVLLAGVAYKPDVEDVRESPALEIIAGLAAEGATVGYIDPLISRISSKGIELDSVTDPAGFAPDLVIMHTSHAGFDLGWLDAVPTVLDTTYKLPAAPNTIQL
ncbi:nucleotide sugar dehydrogenase [Arthrobacter jiangjiafuii]|uniref:Nucleotide sugar dehydrogenase n=1 Tax=Arthrobacter jiangjiafuii TaxID=2817475 RepID=A0A975R114_9MICC|nr:nucleotide sugar dehydrogenase [Arthrobacter jiangjiafuii]MBP3042144.1 nucleotide sugar dehydrogenase [Arthrobacter jiangjiafuii]QWC10083.1 nucleotide sugar dehydrogenase [Arthrobacter jiangjiafuii]